MRHYFKPIPTNRNSRIEMNYTLFISMAYPNPMRRYVYTDSWYTSSDLYFGLRGCCIYPQIHVHVQCGTGLSLPNCYMYMYCPCAQRRKRRKRQIPAVELILGIEPKLENSTALVHSRGVHSQEKRSTVNRVIYGTSVFRINLETISALTKWSR